MQQDLSFFKKAAFITAAVVLTALATQWVNIDWGKLELANLATVTVTGQADGQQLNQLATFRATVAANDNDREVATQTVNEQMSELIEQLKDFGIDEEDLKTENISVYEYNQPERALIYPPQPPVEEPARWQASNTLVVTLRDIDQSSQLATLLTESGATNVSGPNFTVDDTTDLEQQLLEEAMTNARNKARKLLSGSSQKLGKVVSVAEGGTSAPMPYFARGGAALEADSSTFVPTEPGSQTLYKSITVTFEIVD
jgi:uncharacterized protein YggE